MVKAAIQGETPINRPQHHKSKQRRFKKITAKANWFRKDRSDKSDPWETGQIQRQAKSGRLKLKVKDDLSKAESVLFAPHTPSSELKKILQEVDSKVMGNSPYGKVKVVEKLGNSLINSLGNQAPWRREHCQRTGCWPC